MASCCIFGPGCSYLAARSSEDRTSRCTIVLAVSPAAAPYRASGLVHWHFSDIAILANVRFAPRAAIPGMLVFEPSQKTRKMSFGSRPCSSPCKENTRSSAPSSSTICAFPLCQHSVNHRVTALLSTLARCRALLSLLSQRLHQLGFHPRSTRVDKPRKTEAALVVPHRLRPRRWR